MRDGQSPTAFAIRRGDVFISMYLPLPTAAAKTVFSSNDWVREPYTAIACCNDGLRSVIFKLEATNEEVEKDI